MSKLSAPIVIILIVLVILGLGFYQRHSYNSSIIPTPFSKNNATVLNDDTLTNFTASFEIYTDGTKRTFTQAMYHNQSPDVYIENAVPSVIYVKKAGITWSDFFKTLPFLLTQDCLVTGTKQTFCTTETKKLRFLLNGVENPNTLETQIKPNDSLKIIYGD